MSRKAQAVFDGIGATSYAARFTGTIPLEEAEAEAAVYDETLVLVVVGKVETFHPKFDKEGNVTRVNVVKVSDARLVDGELRNVLVEQLGLYGSDTVVIPTMPPAAQPADAGWDPLADDETGEIPTQGVEVLGYENGVQILGHVKSNAGAAPSGGEGPKTVPFNPSDGPIAPATGEVVGRIGRHDSELTSFFDEGL